MKFCARNQEPKYVIDEYKKYFRKILIKYHKDIRAVCVGYNKICDELKITDTDYYI